MTMPWWMVTQGLVDLALLGMIGYLSVALGRARAAVAPTVGPETKAAIADFTALAESLLATWKVSQAPQGGTGSTPEERSAVPPFPRSAVPPDPARLVSRIPEQPNSGTAEQPNASPEADLPLIARVREVPVSAEAGEGMPLSKRLAILRQLEKGLAPDAVARDIGLPVGEVELVARLYGRNGHGQASGPGPHARAEGGASREMWGRPQAAWTHGGVVVHGAEWA